MEKRVLLAVSLSIIIIISWQFFVAEKYYPAKQITSQQITPTSSAPQGNMVEKVEQEKYQPAEKIDETEYVFENEQFVVTLSNIGGCIKIIQLKEFKATKKDSYYVLNSERRPGMGIFSITSQALGIEKDTLPYSINVSGNVIEYAAEVPSKVSIVKRYIFGKKDGIDFQVEFKNLCKETLVFDYDIIGGIGIEAKENMASRYLEVDADVNGTIYRDRLRNKFLLHPGAVKLVALKNQYFSLILKPITFSRASFAREENRVLLSGVRVGEISLQPGSKITNEFLLYAGPIKSERLSSVSAGFEKIIYYGIFGSISEFLLLVLKFFFRLTRSWGISIILLSIVVNFALYPLTRKSFKSMQEMKNLQPEIKKIQEKYKKNPQKLNKEIMGLYKEHKVNPFGGCFPMLLQMPVFVALYNGLSKFIDLKNAQFLWIKDLAAPDSVRLGFVAGANVHILPILMAIVMYVQQKISYPQTQAGLSEQQVQQQKMMATMMPFLFGFIFYNFPSGLVLYWFVNTLIMTGQQMLLIKKTGQV